MVKKEMVKKGNRFKEGQARVYCTEKAATQAHAKAVCAGFCYSTVVQDRRGGTHTLYVRGR